VDPARAAGGEIVEGERARLTEMAKRFSREDLMRAFDVLTKAEQDIRNASQPRYHLEMALLRWMHLRKLVPLAELMEQMGGGGGRAGTAAARPAAPSSAKPSAAAPYTRPPAAAPAPSSRPAAASRSTPSATGRSTPAPAAAGPAPAPAATTPGALKDQLLAEIRASRAFLYNTVVAQAQRIEATDDTVTFTFLPTHKALREQFETQRPWIETAAERLAGRKVAVRAVQAAAGDAATSSAPGQAAASAPAAASTPGAGGDASTPGNTDAKQEALSSPVVRDLLEVFPAEIRNVEEL
jgi:DNA polymerase-3 subunit gamma/tau